jgi:hypothetical protein
VSAHAGRGVHLVEDDVIAADEEVESGDAGASEVFVEGAGRGLDGRRGSSGDRRGNLEGRRGGVLALRVEDASGFARDGKRRSGQEVPALRAEDGDVDLGAV